jgi:hypothetical protein
MLNAPVIVSETRDTALLARDDGMAHHELVIEEETAAGVDGLVSRGFMVNNLRCVVCFRPRVELYFCCVIELSMMISGWKATEQLRQTGPDGIRKMARLFAASLTLYRPVDLDKTWKPSINVLIARNVGFGSNLP